jgi:signal peptidase I
MRSRENRSRIKKKATVRSQVRFAVIAALLGVFVYRFILINGNIPSGSMENTLMPGNRVFGLRISYLFRKPQRGDIVVFRSPLDKSRLFSKRIIGLPGETVRISRGVVYVDGAPLIETYVKDWTRFDDGFLFHVPMNAYLMLGDNRNNSDDSRFWPADALRHGLVFSTRAAVPYAYVEKKDIIGKIYICYWPLKEAGSVYQEKTRVGEGTVKLDSL